MNIPLGYEIGTGHRVMIPARHTIVTGRTQESGKTTTFEALASRSSLRTLAFLTKRGEQSFADGRRIPPYYEDRIDWKSVEAMLGSTIGEKLKYQRAQIMWLCQPHQGGRGKNMYSWGQPGTLADVLSNAELALSHSTSEGSRAVYTLLSEYLRIVVSQVLALPKSRKLELRPGVNVMDLRPYSFETQGLIIRSAVEWIAEREERTATIIPEAWEFMPSNRNSPVLMACEKLIRKGAVIQNYLWLDSQDLASVRTAILKNIGVFILGVQGERNEVDRVLDYLPDAYPRLKRRDIQRLGLGQFWACYEKEMKHVYVQPVWADDMEAQQAARSGGGIVPPPKRVMGSRQSPVGGDEAKPEASEGPDVNVEVSFEREDEEMYKEKYELEAAKTKTLQEKINDLKREIAALRIECAQSNRNPIRESADQNPQSVDLLQIYQYVRDRVLGDPGILEILASKPELRVTVERRTLQVDGDTLRGHIALLIKAGFFAEPANANRVFKELQRRGAKVSIPNVYRECDALAQLGFLFKETAGYQAVDTNGVSVEGKDKFSLEIVNSE